MPAAVSRTTRMYAIIEELHREGNLTVRIAKDDRADFLTVLERLSEERWRDGAYAWGISEDAADPDHIVEWFFVESWAEHMR
jgi:hypothetical protein